MNLCELLLLSNPTVAHPPTHVVASIVFNYESYSCPCVSRASTYVCTNIFSLAQQQRHHKRGYCWLGSPEHLPATSVLLFIINHTWTLRYDNNFHTTKLLLLLIRLANVCFVLCSLKHVLCFINWSERHPSLHFHSIALPPRWRLITATRPSTGEWFSPAVPSRQLTVHHHRLSLKRRRSDRDSLRTTGT